MIYFYFNKDWKSEGRRFDIHSEELICLESEERNMLINKYAEIAKLIVIEYT